MSAARDSWLDKFIGPGVHPAPDEGQQPPEVIQKHLIELGWMPPDLLDEFGLKWAQGSGWLRPEKRKRLEERSKAADERAETAVADARRHAEEIGERGRRISKLESEAADLTVAVARQSDEFAKLKAHYETMVDEYVAENTRERQCAEVKVEQARKDARDLIAKKRAEVEARAERLIAETKDAIEAYLRGQMKRPGADKPILEHCINAILRA